MASVNAATKQRAKLMPDEKAVRMLMDALLAAEIADLTRQLGEAQRERREIAVTAARALADLAEARAERDERLTALAEARALAMIGERRSDFLRAQVADRDAAMRAVSARCRCGSTEETCTFPNCEPSEETSTVIERWTPPENEADPLPWSGNATAEELAARRATFFSDNDVERVAKAIWGTGVNEKWETALTSRKDHYRRCARAAIAAIPSTTEQPRHDRSEERENEH